MKRLLAVVMILMMSIASVGCTQQGDKAASNQSGEPKVLNMALFWLDGNIEPTEGWNGWTLTRCGIGENLVQIDENLAFKPSIAESWEQIDDRTIIFHIRDGVKFHNGNRVDAEACKKSIERALEITDRDDVKFPVESITAEGQKLTIKTSKPYGTLLNVLADTVYIIVDSTAADDEGFKYKPIATGPFKVVEFTPDVGLTLHKHEEHWSGDIGVDIVNVKYIQDPSTRTMALQSGEIDLATQIGIRDLALFENNDDFAVQKGPNLRVFLLRLNMDKPYMKSLAFRQALSYGMDKETYAKELVKGIPAKGPFNDMLSFGYKGEDYYSYNPEKAKELLDKAGFIDTNGDGIREMDGKNIVLKYISRTNHGSDANNIGTAMQAQYKEIGIGLEVIQVENYADMAKSGDFDLLWERWTSAPTADPQYFLEASYKTGSVGNYGKYSNSELDAICTKLDNTFEKAQRDQLGIEGSEILMKDVASLFLYYQEGSVVTRKNVEGVYRYISEIYYIDPRVKIK
ncbi:peptide/nickel transport system substrate-binding protein [Geosporobacter subterraneus DSM 17957]|uniref:Peptide/nickel transport system substrate-binding protein n=1 Tax=Geosporobacter subterraneus DSM 17957 TaxID=1121919 RepID=A0A1M6QA02_9FIRM|nr:ABC transporter substrate-binding protein [Geosporobacter subterraneus]SHK17114.1 peptide/nickel transport system substrate-binding protein [Geosporobacter subterraneus DSM 17957]